MRACVCLFVCVHLFLLICIIYIQCDFCITPLTAFGGLTCFMLHLLCHVHRSIDTLSLLCFAFFVVVVAVVSCNSVAASAAAVVEPFRLVSYLVLPF